MPNVCFHVFRFLLQYYAYLNNKRTRTVPMNFSFNFGVHVTSRSSETVQRSIWRRGTEKKNTHRRTVVFLYFFSAFSPSRAPIIYYYCNNTCLYIAIYGIFSIHFRSFECDSSRIEHKAESHFYRNYYLPEQKVNYADGRRFVVKYEPRDNVIGSTCPHSISRDLYCLFVFSREN